MKRKFFRGEMTSCSTVTPSARVRRENHDGQGFIQPFRKFLALSFFLIVGMTGCGTSDPTAAPAENPTFSITINKTGTGSGTVVSLPEGIDCGATCETEYPGGTNVTLSPTPAAGSTFSGWSGDDDCSDGILLMGAARACTARFDPVVLVSIAVTPADATLPLGGTAQYRATGTFSDNTTQDLTATLTWSSGHPAATVSDAAGSKGEVTGAALGNAAITATDAASGIAGFTTVTVVDQTAPVVTAPASITVPAAGPTGAPTTHAAIQAFLGGASASDNIDGAIAAIRNNAPLAAFSLGVTTVTFSATDAAGNTGSATAAVTVSDQAAPVVTAPAPITVSAVDATGTPQTAAAIQTFLNAVLATDNVDGAIAATNNAPVTFLPGTTTVTFSATDAAGNTGTATVTVTVTDQTAPVVTPPASITVAAASAAGTPSAAAAIQTFLNAVLATDNVDGAIAATNNAPVTFPPGTTTVIFSATDAAGNTGTASATVTVADQTAPVVTAPASITVPAAGPTGAPTTDAAIQAFLGGASANDNIDGAIAAISNNTPLAAFPVGVTIVIFSATDAAGNTGSATAAVTVSDQAAPVVTAPAPITVVAVDASGTPAGDAAIQAFLSGAAVTDNVDTGLTATNNAPTVFPLGVTTVTFSATDAAGNTGTASATVTVSDQSAPVVTAPAPITVVAASAAGTPSAAAAIQAFLSSSSATDNVDGPIATVSHSAVPVTFPVGVTIVTFNATDAAGNAGTATSTVTIVVEGAPVVTAPAPIVVSAVDGTGTPTANAAITAFLSAATATDEIDGPITAINNNALVFPVGITTVTFSATDSAGNTGQAQSTVRVSDQAAPVVTAPAAMTVSAVNTSGTPSADAVIQTFLNAATATDNVDGAIALVTNDAPAAFPLGITTVTFSATDAAGNIGSATATVTVSDQTPPVVTVPAPITVASVDASGTPSAAAAIQAFLSAASATDNVDGPIATVTNNAPGTFPQGVTAVTFSAVDINGNTGTATATVTVTDQTKPVVIPPASITVPAVDGSGAPAAEAAIQAFLNAASATDNVDGVVALVANDAPLTFGLGVTTVTFSATDAAGNTGTAAATVTVTDQTAPVVTAPASITVAAVNATGTPTVNAAIQAFLGGALATDNVDGPIALVTNDAPAATFALGVTTVTFSATDAAGNIGTATATVTVTDQSAPTVTAPASIIVPAVDASGTPVGDAAIQAFLNSASATDNVDTSVTVTNDAPATFPLGTTTVTFSATDTAGNTGTATANVTVTDQAKPVITLLGVSPLTVPQGSVYTDAGATAFDAVDGDLTASIVTVNPVNTAVAGIYFVTYNVSDAAGNTANQVSRTVEVKAFHTLTVAKSGTGSGTVTSFPAGINCGADCAEDLPAGTIVSLNPVPAAGSIFFGWSGDADCADGAVSMTGARHCIAAFDLATVSLTVTTTGLGSGEVSSSPAGISCGTFGTDCNALFIEGSSVTLSAVPDVNAGFSGWSGPCAGSGATCTLTLTADTAVNAAFDPAFSISGFISGAPASTTVRLKDAGGTVLETVSAVGGSFTFQPQPAGDYTVEPAAAAKTAPASRNVTITTADVTGLHFTATHTVSGTVTYSGAKTGGIFVRLHFANQNDPNGYGAFVDAAAPGTVIPFTIRGVPSGTYDVEARLDHLGTTLRNAANPSGRVNSVSVGNADVILPLITLADPAAAVVPQTPLDPGGLSLEGGALFFWEMPRDVNSVEIADSYRIYSKSGAVDVSTSVFDAVVTVSTLADGVIPVPNLLNGTRYTFIITALAGGLESAPTAPVEVTPGVPAGGVSVSGTITFPAVPATPGGSTLAVILDTDALPFVVMLPVNAGATSAAYTVKGIPPGDYILKALIDVGNDGILENPGDFTTGLDFNGEGVPLTVGTAPMTGQNLTMSGANAFYRVSTRHTKSHDGFFEGYGLIFEGTNGSKLPVKTVITGPNLPDTDAIPGGSFRGEFDLWLPYDLPRPTVGETYVFDANFLGDALGAPPEVFTGAVSAVLDSFATPIAPIGAVPGQTTPTFTWSVPAAPPTPPFSYSLGVFEELGGNQVWFTDERIPGAQTSIPFNDDGSASVSALTPGVTYLWNLTVEDRQGNRAELNGISFVP